MLKKSSDFFGRITSEVVVSLGIKYEPLLPPTPPSLRCVSGAFGSQNINWFLLAQLPIVYTRVQVERVYKSNPIFEAKNTTFLEKV